MQFFYMLFLISIFFTSHAFGYSCYFRPYFEGGVDNVNIRVADINGRQIYTLFRPYVVYDTSEEFEDIYYSITEYNVMDVIRRLNRLLDEHIDTVLSEKSDFRQISSLLDEGEIDWIGIETSPELFREFNESTLLDYLSAKISLTFIKDLPGWSEEKANDALHLGFPVETMIQAEYPDILVIPLQENNSEMSFATVTTARNELIEGMSIEQWNAVSNYLEGGSDVQNLEVFLSHNPSSDVVRKVERFNDLAIRYEGWNRSVIETILTQADNGLVIKGLGRKEDVERRLELACLLGIGTKFIPSP